ncbi:laminin subunit beta-1-like isoform X1 [Apostichopus japonicus]|uniref:laminin subunit beta-1-like isoform X1 n=1 Tax=Stichopus japonicus TaxID=307972 RepID=UPI003AB2B2B4
MQSFIKLCLLGGCLFQVVYGQIPIGQDLGPNIPFSECEGGSCYTGDLLIGREDRLYAASTCGMEKPERYCIVSHLEDKKKCFYCDSRQPYSKGRYEISHRIENVVTSFMAGGKKMWWQSENGVEEVYIQFDLEAIFHFTHLIMTFKTFRPRALTIERSSDFGSTWRVYRHFAYDCSESFPDVPTGPLRNLNDVICEESYSTVEPSSNGEVIFRVLPPHIRISDPYSDAVQDMINITNLRINFTQLHTLGDDLVDNRPEVIEKYYYAMYDMVVRGSCHCFGHASRCIPAEGMEGRRQMNTNVKEVFGKCECTHNTEGNNCERCRPFYNALKWQPSTPVDVFECKLCNCNDHATSCHYDGAVFELTGSTGDVCDDCQHNTMGRNCEQCQPFYYQHPNRDIRDPSICVPCSCDPLGSEDNGECLGHSDPARGLAAGQCFCKTYVTGESCDSCQDGYYDLSADNPDGCSACACNILGTIGNMGCDKTTGNCECKRFVTGRDCDSCYDGYYGLSESIYGCEYCDCDPGGAYNNSCNQQSGQCHCRPHITSRRCKEVESGHFFSFQDHYTYEAELADIIGDLNLASIEQRIRPDGAVIRWTGPGFMKVTEHGSIEFTINNIPASGDYDLYLRYEPLRPYTWDDVRVTVNRPGTIPTSSRCGNTIPQDDLMMASLPSNRRYVNISSVCLEEGKTYTIRIDVERYRDEEETPGAEILLDSIVLVSQVNDNELFKGDSISNYRREQWEYYRCGESHLSGYHSRVAPVCEQLMFSMSAIIHDGALDCECNPTGSFSAICEEFGGQCQCKPNVIGRKCDRCAPGTYGFGPNGCVPCECDLQGSYDEFCNPSNGQCPCRQNTYGRQCNQCQPGFFNFPNCRKCVCNGHADTCEQTTGNCISCRDFTDGNNCESCLDGYYGRPTIEDGVPCEPCLCPGGVANGNQFADTCSLDEFTLTVSCDCYSGYTGISCNVCDNNYYGNPEDRGGQCQVCNCNGNTNPRSPGNCDSGTGQCLQCLYDTAGDSCEECAPNFYGDALLRTCTACSCFILGTDRDVCDADNNCGICDSNTGQCPCLPNVIGRTCSQCAPDHWRIASGTGCEACDCCSYGSVASQCDSFTGQCRCRAGFGGRTCCGCEDLFYGDPRTTGCQACDCDPDGSLTLQCNQDGSCVCKEGVTGYRCDQCDRGYQGDVPVCESCGECFHNWDRIIAELKNETDALLGQSTGIKPSGIARAYEDELAALEVKLQAVQGNLTDPSVNEEELETFQKSLKDMKGTLKRFGKKIKELNRNLADLDDGDARANRELDAIEEDCMDLEEEAERLKATIVEVESTNIDGAFNNILKSQNESRAIQGRVDDASALVDESSTVRAEVEAILAQRQSDLEDQKDEYNGRIDDIENQLTGLEGRLAELNEEICGAPGDECGACGGAGCGYCGGLGCTGSKTTSQDALKRAEEAEKEFERKLKESENTLTDVKDLQVNTEEALAIAQEAYDASLQAKMDAEGAKTNLTDLIEDIMDFLLTNRAHPDSIRDIAEMALGTQMSRTPEEIKELAEQIEDTVAGLKNIDDILNETRDDLRLVQELKARADKARDFAEEVKSSAEGVAAALEEAAEAQGEADAAIKQANKDIGRAENEITQITSEAEAAGAQADDLQAKIDAMKRQLQDVQGRFIDNEAKIDEATLAAQDASDTADLVQQEAGELADIYNKTAGQIFMKAHETELARNRSRTLLEMATKFKERAQQQYEELQAMETKFVDNQNTLTDLTDEIAELNMQMEAAIIHIQDQATHYRECNRL